MIDISSLTPEERRTLAAQLTDEPPVLAPVSTAQVQAWALAEVNRIMAAAAARTEPANKPGEKTTEYTLAREAMGCGKLIMALGALGPMLELAQEVVRAYQALPAAQEHSLGWMGAAVLLIGAAKNAYVKRSYDEARAKVKAGQK